MSWLAAVAAVAPPDPNRPALYASVSAVVVALIGGAVALLTSRQRRAREDEAPPPAPPSPPRELAEMLVTTIAERDLWRARALAAGWVEP